MKIRDKLPSNSSRSPIKIATTSERLQKIMVEKQIKQADLARATGISRGAISNYVLGRYAPKSDIVQNLASALNCSALWLSGYDVPMEKSARSTDEENPYVLEVSDNLEEMDVDDQIYARDWIRAFKKDPQKMKTSPTADEELAEYLEMLRTRPEMRMLFRVSKDATKADVEKAVAIVEALRKTEG